VQLVQLEPKALQDQQAHKAFKAQLAQLALQEILEVKVLLDLRDLLVLQVQIQQWLGPRVLLALIRL
jgi:hypothetical protein